MIILNVVLKPYNDSKTIFVASTVTASRQNFVIASYFTSFCFNLTSFVFNNFKSCMLFVLKFMKICKTAVEKRRYDVTSNYPSPKFFKTCVDKFYSKSG